MTSTGDSFSDRQPMHRRDHARDRLRSGGCRVIRTKGITRCPTACVLPTHGLAAAADRAALEEYAAARDRSRRARAAARWRAFWNVEAPLSGRYNPFRFDDSATAERNL